ncbi:MAG: PLDc N-terminal domain-containing protein [Planctomycetota bacterium]
MIALSAFAPSLLAAAGDAAAIGTGIGGLLCFGLVALMGLVGTIFWIYALVDAIRNPRLSDQQRLIWILVIVLTTVLGSIVYFLIGRSGK